MYDFYFGTPEEIRGNEEKFLLSIKRMMPRWCNSILDSEYLAIGEILEKECPKNRPILVETGSGASSIVMLHFAFKYEGLLFTWDIVGPKGAYLRGVCTDSLQRHHKKNIFDHWQFIAYDSLSPQLGLAILPELTDRVDMCFIDSQHTLDQLIGELEILNPLFHDGSIICMDDGNYTWRHTNYSYINMFRRKLQLPELKSPPENICEPFWMEVERHLKTGWEQVEPVENSYRQRCTQDMFQSYYAAERELMAETGMQKISELEELFWAWKIKGRKKP